MVVKANRQRPKVTTHSPPGTPTENAMRVRLAPVSPESMTPVMTMARPVIVQTMSVSMNVPSMAIVPCLTGSSVRAAACAIGALPSPASLEKMPRATPMRSAISIVAPAKPPPAAWPVKALLTTVTTAPGSAPKLSRISPSPASR